jgi:hypothetical protein
VLGVRPFAVFSYRGGALVAVLIWWLLVQSPRLAGLLSLGGERNRRDPAVWLLAGATVAGVGGMWLFAHPSGSQTYFYLGVIPFGTVLTARLLADRQPGQRPLLGGLLGGFLAAGALARLPAPGTVWDMFWPLPVFLAAVVLTTALLTRRRTLPMILLAAVLGGSIGAFTERTLAADWRMLRDPNRHVSDKLITHDEMVAARWIDRHADRDDLVATNVHCWPPGGAEAGCDARAFWVAALTGRRTLIESWGYTDAAVAADGHDGLPYYRQPPPAVYDLNQRAFTSGDVSGLRARGVRWLLADRRAGVVGIPGEARFTAGSVSVYELR